MLTLQKAASVALAALGSLSYAYDTVQAPVLVDLTDGSVVGGLYRPANPGPKAEIAVFIMHLQADYISFIACTELAARGYTVFCADGPESKLSTQTDVELEDTMDAIAVGVNYLRERSDIISKIVLLGHSGGGAAMSAYQNIAENGRSACNGSEKILPCSSTFPDLPAADGIMLIDANYGMSSMMLFSLGAEIIEESSGMDINYNLSVYNPANGFNSTGISNYTSRFVNAYFSAVANRMQRIVNHAEKRLAVIEAGKGDFSDDEELYIPDALYSVYDNKLFSQDTKFLSHTEYAWPLLHKNESITTEIVHSVRVPTDFGPSEAKLYADGASKTSIRRFLGAFAMRVGDDFSYNETSFTGIQWNSSHMVPIQAVPGIKSPLLTMGMTGHWEYLNAEKIYLNSGSNDSTICFVEGASHGITTCTACETYPGEYGNTTKTAFDYMASWLGKEGRFL